MTRRFLERRLRFGVAPLALQHVREVVQHGVTNAGLASGLLQRRRRLGPLPLPGERDADEEARRRIRGTQLEHAPQLAQRFVEHAGLIERDTEISVLFDARLRHLRIGVGLGAADAMDEAGG